MTDLHAAKQKAQRRAQRALADSGALVKAVGAVEPASARAVRRPAGPEFDDESGDASAVTFTAYGSVAVDERKAGIATAPLLPGTQTIKAYTDHFFSGGGAPPGAIGEALRKKSAAVHGNDLKDAESTLVIQATALDAIFNQLAFKAAQSMGNLDGLERYLRLAMKAQAQCCRTLEVLADIKNPTVFARQANVNMGGQQQVNNGVEQERASVASPKPRARTAKNPG